MGDVGVPKGVPVNRTNGDLKWKDTEQTHGQTENGREPGRQRGGRYKGETGEGQW